ncbi:hypothetical protein CLV33_103290 [Jejuia pallidilutea]|uniref:Polysaccharide biosynthesis protein n=2 Tax=Jejuia pallidilutea TaxID=504487 RepID=A0A362X480_9FLAO|nr:hypothetical protein CLV33_103290 [Jejuia pallidilutea]
MALSYFDKAIIFLLPLLVLYLFGEKEIYVSIEYIYSITIVAIPLLDLGLSGYFFYAYREADNKNEVLEVFTNFFKRLYILIGFVGLIFIAVHYLVFPFENLILFIVYRVLFVLATTFLASYFRLINKPQKVVFITILSNTLSLLFLFFYFFLNYDFSLWLIFIGQILFSSIYFFKCLKDVLVSINKKLKVLYTAKILKDTILFSWPNIIQTFLLLYISNYGKINALTKMPIDDGVLLSLVQRFSMLIFLTHSSVWAFLVKDIYVEKNVLHIRKSILYKYLILLSFALFMVVIIASFLLSYNYVGNSLYRSLKISFLIIGQTFLGCIYAYLEVHYGRENKNIIKLYLAIFGALIFVTILVLLQIDFLERISIAMFASTLVSLLLSMFILYKRNYKMV